MEDTQIQNLMQNQSTLSSGYFWMNFENYVLFPIFLNSLLATNKLLWLFNSYFRKLPCKCFLLWLSSIYTHFTWFFVLASLHHPQLFPLWMGTFSTHRFTHFTFHFRGKIFSSQIAKDLRSLATANENYLCQLKLRETLWATRMRKGDTGRPHGVGRKIQELRLLFLFFPVVLTFF